MKIIFDPSEAHLAKLKSLPEDEPVAALNLFHFNERARYQPEDPEFGTAEADISCQEAFTKYGAIAGKIITDIGGRLVFSTPVVQMMIGPDDAAWEQAAIMFFPTRRAFMQMLSDPEFKSASRHRKAALANHRMIHLDGNPFVD